MFPVLSPFYRQIPIGWVFYDRVWTCTLKYSSLQSLRTLIGIKLGLSPILLFTNGYSFIAHNGFSRFLEPKVATSGPHLHQDAH